MIEAFKLDHECDALSMKNQANSDQGAIYLRDMGGGAPQLWHVTERAATKLEVTNPTTGPGCYFAATEGQDVWAVMKANTPWFDNGSPFTPLTLPIGAFHPRMARPMHFIEDNNATALPLADPSLMVSSRTQVEILGAQLSRICRTVHPDAATFSAYGHDIRNLLILAGSEVEIQLRGILSANGSTRPRPKTDAYFVVGQVMRLAEYAVGFNAYPWLSPIAPFAGWVKGDPTESLPWYGAYNAVKHDREREFPKANLRHALEAVAACVTLQAAQFGQVFGLGGTLDSAFRLARMPKWAMQDYYYASAASWTPVPHHELAAIAIKPKAKS